MIGIGGPRAICTSGVLVVTSSPNPQAAGQYPSHVKFPSNRLHEDLSGFQHGQPFKGNHEFRTITALTCTEQN